MLTTPLWLYVVGCMGAAPAHLTDGPDDVSDAPPPDTSAVDTVSSTGDTGRTSLDLTLDTTGDIEGLGFVLFRVQRPASRTRADFGFGEVLTSGMVDDKQHVLPLPLPPVEHFGTFPNTNVALAAYLVALFEDADGDATYDDDELLAAVSPSFATYVASSPLPNVVTDLGLRTGWNAATWWEEDPLVVTERTILPIEVKAQNVTLDLEGTLDGDLAGHRVVLLSGNDDPVLTTALRLFDEPASAKVSVSLEGAPPADHLSKTFPYTSHSLRLAYDADVSDSYTDGDPTSAFCRAGGSRALFVNWVVRNTSPNFTWLYEGHTGWVGFDVTIVKSGARFRVLTDTVDDLVAKTDCF